MGRLEELAAGHDADVADRAPQVEARRLREERRREQKRLLLLTSARDMASEEAKRLLGRVIFPARWSARFGESPKWIICEALFEGKILLRLAYWTPRISESCFTVAPIHDPEDRRSFSSREQLVLRLRGWGLV
jgi:hypothetical protein